MSLPKIYPQLLKIREASKVSLKPNKYLREDTKLRHYQAQMVMHLLMMNKMVVGDDVGLGKTLEMITAYTFYLQKNSDIRLVWLGPKNSLYQVQNEFKRFTNGISTYVARSIKKEDREYCKTGYLKKYKKNSTYCRICEHATWCEKRETSLRGIKNADFRKLKYLDFRDDGTNVLILNYDLARTDFREIIECCKPYIVVFDEATAFKSYKSKTWSVCKELAENSEKAWPATATIIKNRLEEAYSIYKCILPNILGNKTQFLDNFCITKKIRVPKSRRKIPLIVGYKNLDEFKKAIDPYFLGRAAREVGIELPDLISKEIELDLTPIQVEKYQEALDGLLETDQGKIKEVTQLTAINYCQQIVNSPHLVGVEGTSCKEEALFELLENDFKNEKIIFFTRFRKWVDRLEILMKERDLKPLRITGAESAEKREENKLLFQKSSEHNIIMITTAGGQALNLQAARILIWGDLILSYGDVLQVIGRMIRYGSPHKKVLAIHLICRNTVDDHTFKIVLPKKKLFEQILGKRHEGLLEFEGFGESEVKGVFKALLKDAQNKDLFKKPAKEF